jgi:hypothetical protein
VNGGNRAKLACSARRQQQLLAEMRSVRLEVGPGIVRQITGSLGTAVRRTSELLFEGRTEARAETGCGYFANRLVGQGVAFKSALTDQVFGHQWARREPERVSMILSPAKALSILCCRRSVSDFKVSCGFCSLEDSCSGS